MSGFCDECRLYVYKLYKVKDMKLCKNCTIDYFEMNDEECYELNYEEEDEEDE